MADRVRPFLREAFLLGERALEVFFHTSNVAKYLQARAVFDRVGLRLQHFRSTTEPYTEDYSLGKERLLTRAVDEIKSRVGRGTIFFVEDTSLRIEGISGDDDFPGLAVKEWFERTPFADLDAQLTLRARDRRATVKADIALHLPGLRRPLIFHGETQGMVAATPPTFAPSAQYPWLTPHTFNGWFIPDGAVKRLGEMSFEESWKHDFRVRAMLELINRLEEYAVILNISPPAYSRRNKVTIEGQGTLWKTDRQVLIVVGRTCAGKTTFGERAAERHNFRFLEASAVLRMLAEGAVDPGLTAFEIADTFLRSHGADIVARKVVEILDIETDRDVVITGFRAVEEVDLLKRVMPDARVVLIEASERSRFERHLARGRLDGITTMTAFRALDSEQGMFGLLRVAEDFADIRILNEGSLEVFWAQVDAVITHDVQAALSGISWDVHPRLTRDRNQTYHALRALDQTGRPLDCNEIEELTAAAGHRIRYNNANKVLKRIPGLARRIESPNMLVRYEILSAGRAYLRYMDRVHRE
ncbi:MAG TPA: non-canonical purine NTP pyrophosphatase [Thermoanaerobaculia bacterium]|nr:non-canonical purine NTP pyrophosphatase [Thermoanaerobaculia bacterium]